MSYWGQVVVFVVRVTVFFLMISLALQYCIRYDENTADDPNDPKPAHISELAFFDIR